MKKTLLVLLVILIFTSAIFGGCKEKSSDTIETTTTVATTTTTQTTTKTEATTETSEAIIVPEYMNLDGYPITKEKITLKMMGSKHPFHVEWSEMYFFKFMEEMTNMHFEFDTPPATNFIEKLNLTLAGGDLPDIFFNAGITSAMELQYGTQGFFVDMKEMIENYAPNIKTMFEKRDDVKKAITTPGGEIFGMPLVNDNSVAGVSTMWINGEWLQSLNINKLPETVDELYELLVKFKENDPNENGEADEIPMSSITGNDVRTPILPAFGLLSAGIEVKDDKVIFSPIEQGFKEYLIYMKKLYDEKLVDNEMFSQTLQQMAAKGKENKVGMFTHAVPSIAFKEDSVLHVALPVMTSSINNEKRYPVAAGIAGPAGQKGFVITRENEYPEASVRWIDYVYSPEGSLLLHYGGENNYWEWTDESKTIRRTKTPPEGLALGQLRGQFTPDPGNHSPFWARVEVSNSFEGDFFQHRIKEVEGKLRPYGVVPYPLLYNTLDEQKRLSVLQTDINTYVDTMQAKFITGQESLDNWDNYVSTIKKMGVDELIEIQQTAYDRWKSVE